MKEKKLLPALRAAFPHTLPVLAGFGFLGVTYGILMNVSGFAFWQTALISLTVFAGSMQFVAVNLLLSAFDPLAAFFMTLMINARHLFYGISMLDKYKGLGIKRFYLIFGMCDETFSINCTATPPPSVDRGLFMLSVTALDHFYWVAASTIGGLFGGLIRFKTEGLDFAMTALFVVILTEQLRDKKSRPTALLGLILSALCLVLFGADRFVIPAMVAILLSLSLLKRVLERGEAV